MIAQEKVRVSSPFFISNNSKFIKNINISSNHNYIKFKIIIKSISYILKSFPAMVSQNSYVLNLFDYLKE